MCRVPNVQDIPNLKALIIFQRSTTFASSDISSFWVDNTVNLSDAYILSRHSAS